jgi:cyclophilin family peptidyl-prolyl cis-trans isomerase
MRRLPLLLLLALSLAFAACGGDDKKDAEATPAATEAVGSGTEAGCQKVEAPKPKGEGKLEKPKEVLDKAKTYVAKVLTSCGEFEITLDSKRSPKTGGSFKYMAEKGVFDNTTFHRVISGFVIQGGDPLGNGTGGPGFSVVEAPPENLVYERGVVAMAKTGQERDGTSGSQFFVVVGEEAASLPPDYALLGKVTKGMDIADRISVVPTGGADAPVDPVVIRQVTVTEK